MPPDSPLDNLNERSQQLFKVLVEQYIHDGQPVASKALSSSDKINLSPATVRNVMSDLEDLGLIISPHTSAGRIPTAQGYRLFVDNLVCVKPLKSQAVADLRKEMGIDDSQEALINKASTLLSGMTKMAGVVTIPRREAIILRHIEFLPLTSNRILVILVVNEQEVQNRVIHTDKAFTESELAQTANYLNQTFKGNDLSQIRSEVLSSMKQERDDMQNIMKMAIQMTDSVVDDQSNDDFVMAGQTNLMEYSEMANMEQLRQLFDAFNAKRDVLHVLDQSIQAEGMQVFIGEESGYSAFESCSVITAPYKMSDEVVGVLGVIGPTRMAYDKVIPIVDVTAKLLGSLLSSEE
ncbi:MAG: heat-inducible transcriptional repressor HrcA [Woeseiaceae bacterium]